MRTENPRKAFAIRAADFEERFAADSPDQAQLVEHLENIVRDLTAKQACLDEMFAHFDEVGFGATFANRNKQYGIVLPDASHPGLFRCQHFDSRGFFGHSTLPSPDRVILELCEDGYKHIVHSNTLADMSQTQEWERGMAKLAVLQAAQTGTLTWREANQRAMEIDQQFGLDTEAAA